MTPADDIYTSVYETPISLTQRQLAWGKDGRPIGMEASVKIPAPLLKEALLKMGFSDDEYSHYFDWEKKIKDHNPYHSELPALPLFLQRRLYYMRYAFQTLHIGLPEALRWLMPDLAVGRHSEVAVPHHENESTEATPVPTHDMLVYIQSGKYFQSLPARLTGQPLTLPTLASEDNAFFGATQRKINTLIWRACDHIARLHNMNELQLVETKETLKDNEPKALRFNAQILDEMFREQLLTEGYDACKVDQMFQEWDGGDLSLADKLLRKPSKTHPADSFERLIQLRSHALDAIKRYVEQLGVCKFRDGLHDKVFYIECDVNLTSSGQKRWMDGDQEPSTYPAAWYRFENLQRELNDVVKQAFLENGICYARSGGR